jgi:hypothetical protein
MKRFYQVFAFFILLLLWAPCLKGQNTPPAGAVQVLDARAAVVEVGKKLKLSLTITNHSQLTEIVIVQNGLAAGAGGAYGGIISYTPYYYLGDLFLVHRDKQVPFTGNYIELELELAPETKSASPSLTLVALDRNRRESAPFVLAY